MVIKNKATEEQPKNYDAKNKLIGIGISPDVAVNFLAQHPDIQTLNILYDTNIDDVNSSVCHDMIDEKGRTLTLVIKDTVFLFYLLYL